MPEKVKHFKVCLTSGIRMVLILVQKSQYGAEMNMGKSFHGQHAEFIKTAGRGGYL